LQRLCALDNSPLTSEGRKNLSRTNVKRNITLQRHLYAYVFKHKELGASKTPFTLVANERKPTILHGQILETRPSDVVGIMRGRAEYDRPCFASILGGWEHWNREPA
jgi:hypothetical protein